ncbi:uncharacterized protein LOC108865248 [Galendromus occidentalis]|uniref:Uncharacterized protein LOC108865248 n=1 Tax=Galendromus occidentalis TaxID=34638 RepID=A0AAJ7L6T5_9ACAR|nr:uncharacterized protein LOC108865248 [Galendromus occidentalis]
MPNLTLLRQQVNYHRARAGPSMRINPSQRADLEIPDELMGTHSGEQFLHYDSGVGDSKRIIVFATAKNLKLLRNCNEWFMDGTFKACPSIFYQLFTVHVKLFSSKVIPVIYAFLPAKDGVTYRKLFELIHKAVDGSLPQVIHLDSEKALMNELSARFPLAEIVGCNFHFNQSLWRHIQSDPKLCHEYLNNLDANMNLRMLAALAFVPCAQNSDVWFTKVEAQFRSARIISEETKYYKIMAVLPESAAIRVREVAPKASLEAGDYNGLKKNPQAAD